MWEAPDLKGVTALTEHLCFFHNQSLEALHRCVSFVFACVYLSCVCVRIHPHVQFQGSLTVNGRTARQGRADCTADREQEG